MRGFTLNEKKLKRWQKQCLEMHEKLAKMYDQIEIETGKEEFVLLPTVTEAMEAVDKLVLMLHDES